MNVDPEKLQALMEDLVPPSSERCGPSSSAVAALVRGERRRRQRNRLTASASAALLAVAVLSFALREPTGERAASRGGAGVTVVHAPAPIVIRRVNDEQLLGLLQGQTRAVLALPNGDRHLLVLEP